MTLFFRTLLGQAIAVLVMFGLFVGPFVVLRFDHAAYVAGAALLVVIALIYWPRKRRAADDEKD